MPAPVEYKGWITLTTQGTMIYMCVFYICCVSDGKNNRARIKTNTGWQDVDQSMSQVMEKIKASA